MRKTIVTVILAIGLFGCQSEKEEAIANKKSPPLVTLHHVSAASPLREMTISGITKYREETPLGFTTAGKVAHIAYDEGERVSKGAVLARLDTTDVRAKLNSARAEYDRASAQYERLAPLFEKGWITRPQMDQALASKRAAAAQVKSAQFASNTAQIIAPSNGVILSRSAQTGQVVAAGTQILTLGKDNKGLIFEAQLSDRQVSLLHQGMSATVTLGSDAGETITGEITEISGRADPLSGQFKAIIQLPFAQSIKSGQIGTATFHNITQKNVETPLLTLSASAIFAARSDEAFVWLYDDKSQTVTAQNIAIDHIDNDLVYVKSGLKAGQKIVDQGLDKLQEGSKVKIAPSQKRQVKKQVKPSADKKEQ